MQTAELHDGPKSGTVMASRVRGKDPPHPGWSSESQGLTSFQKKPYPHQQERFRQAWGWGGGPWGWRTLEWVGRVYNMLRVLQRLGFA